MVAIRFMNWICGNFLKDTCRRLLSFIRQVAAQVSADVFAVPVLLVININIVVYLYDLAVFFNMMCS